MTQPPHSPCPRPPPHPTPRLTALPHLCVACQKFCSPTRSAAQTGRNPIHVNVQNLDPNNYNPKDPVSGMSAVPRNMTGVAEVMKRAGYKTAFCECSNGRLGL